MSEDDIEPIPESYTRDAELTEIKDDSFPIWGCIIVFIIVILAIILFR